MIEPTSIPEDIQRYLAVRLRSTDNSLAPGFDAIELSFSEADPAALRLDWEPDGPLDQRRRLAVQWADDQSVGFQQIVEPLLHHPPREPVFGAYLGCVIRPTGTSRKLYLEVDRPEILPLELATLVPWTCMEPIRPHFVSLVTGEGPVQARLYLSNPQPLSLLALLPLLERAGYTREATPFLRQLSELLGGQWMLPADRMVLGLRRTDTGPQLKVDLLHPQPPPAPQCWPGLRQRQPDWSAWLRRVEAKVGPCFLGAIGLSLSPGQLHTTAYLRFHPQPAHAER